MADLESELKRARDAERAGRLDEALAAYRRASAIDPGAGAPRIRIIGLHLVAGRTEEAEREARAFADAGGGAEALATLGQVLRLTARPAEAVEALLRACAMAPRRPELRTLLNEARRAVYWLPDAARMDVLMKRFKDVTATPADLHALLHLRFAGLLSPEIQRWITAGGEERIPEALVAEIDARYGGRFTKEVDALLQLAETLRRSGPVAPARARVTTASGVLEGELSDTDATILGSLEVVDRDAYAILPFGALRRLEIRSRGPWFSAAVTWRDGPERVVEIPALYLFTDGSRDAKLRDGSLTLWRGFRDRFRIGLGLRDFFLASGDKGRLVGLDDVRAVEFL